MDINKYNKSELEQVYAILKKYRDLKKNIGKKSDEVIYFELNNEKKILIEYFTDLKIEEIKDFLKNLYKKHFDTDIDLNKATFKANSDLKWWVRIFLWDDMVDISFENIYNKISKI